MPEQWRSTHLLLDELISAFSFGSFGLICKPRKQDTSHRGFLRTAVSSSLANRSEDAHLLASRLVSSTIKTM